MLSEDLKPLIENLDTVAAREFATILCKQLDLLLSKTVDTDNEVASLLSITDNTDKKVAILETKVS